MDEGLMFIEHLPMSTYNSYQGLIFFVLIYLVILTISIALQRKSRTWFYLSTASIFMSVLLISLQHVQQQRECRVTFYTLRKHAAFAFFDRGRATVYADMKHTDPTMGYSVLPSVNALANKAVYLNYHVPAVSGSIVSTNNFFIFHDWKMLMWDSSMNGRKFSRKVAVDVVLLSGKPRLKLSNLLETVRFRLLLIDGTNSDYAISKWKAEADQLSINYYILKKQPAYTINLSDKN
jgi:competence protein ComEC